MKCIVYVVFFVSSWVSFLRAADVRVLAGVSTEGPVWVGERVSYYMEIQTDTWFSGPIEMVAPGMDGAILGQLETFGINGTARINGETYTTHRKEFVLFALAPGVYEIPAGLVRAQVANPGGAPEDVSIASPAVTLEAVFPSGVEGDGPLIVSPQLTVTESWDPKPGEAKVGDAFTRTIVMEASNVMGMVFPVVPEVQMAGLRVYRDPPRVEDKTGRGSLTGTREEVLTYVFEQPGSYELAPLSLRWWNSRQNALEVETLPAAGFEVIPGALAIGSAGSMSSDSGEGVLEKWGWSLLVSFLMGVALLLWFRGKLAGKESKSEPNLETLFRTLLHRIPEGDARDIYRETQSWLALAEHGDMEQFRQMPGFHSLEAAVSGYHFDWDRTAYRAELSEWWKKQADDIRPGKARPLADLNPRG